MKKILVVDDNEANRYLLISLLRTNGYEVATANNGEQALDLARLERPDLIVTDILMPVMDGFTLCRHWRGDEVLKDIPFVFYTATYTDAGDEAFALSLGADAFFIKPEEPDRLLDNLRKILSIHGASRHAASAAPLDEQVYLKQYNQTLVRKLEDKMTQLELANRTLLQDNAARRKAEEEVKRLNENLEQRVRERTAELEAANEELAAFSYSVSHDLNAPLRHISGYARLLVQDAGTSLSPTALNHLATIEERAGHMGKLIEALLALSRLGRTPLRFAPVALDRMVPAVIRELQADAAGRKIDWQIAPLPVVAADETLLKQVWFNLLANSLKYTRKQPFPRIEIGVQGGGPSDEAVFYVRDNGVGFDMEYADKLFGVFQRLHSEQEFEGTGAGLSSVRRILQRHGGRIWAEAKKDHGATFYFTLPLAGKTSHIAPPGPVPTP